LRIDPELEKRIRARLADELESRPQLNQCDLVREILEREL
jgi:hypothetical protein